MATPSVEDMRTAIGSRYPGSAWSRKVECMPDNQVLAIYKRMESAGMFDKPVKLTRVPPPPPIEVYECPDCNAAFIADNPELTECRYCGSKNIEKAKVVKIEKENTHEN